MRRVGQTTARITADEVIAAVHCPYVRCKAAKGQPCVDPQGGTIDWPHMSRVRSVPKEMWTPEPQDRDFDMSIVSEDC